MDMSSSSLDELDTNSGPPSSSLDHSGAPSRSSQLRMHPAHPACPKRPAFRPLTGHFTCLQQRFVVESGSRDQAIHASASAKTRTGLAKSLVAIHHQSHATPACQSPAQRNPGCLSGSSIARPSLLEGHRHQALCSLNRQARNSCASGSVDGSRPPGRESAGGASSGSMRGVAHGAPDIKGLLAQRWQLYRASEGGGGGGGGGGTSTAAGVAQVLRPRGASAAHGQGAAAALQPSSGAATQLAAAPGGAGASANRALAEDAAGSGSQQAVQNSSAFSSKHSCRATSRSGFGPGTDREKLAVAALAIENAQMTSTLVSTVACAVAVLLGFIALLAAVDL
jgi:hypothetical protein